MEISKSSRKKSTKEKVAQIVFTFCASFTILAVLSIMVYMIINGTPALFKVGLKEIIFGISLRMKVLLMLKLQKPLEIPIP
mgnify:CR=1 FL=1